MNMTDRDLLFKVKDIECWKCSKTVEGVIVLDRWNLMVKTTSGFTIFPDGIICSECLGESKRRVLHI